MLKNYLAFFLEHGFVSAQTRTKILSLSSGVDVSFRMRLPKYEFLIVNLNIICARYLF